MWYLLVGGVIVCAIIIYWMRNKESDSTMALGDILPETFIVVDIETTGLDADFAHIIEIAAIKVRKGSDQHETLTALVNPDIKIPKKITKITGITQEMIDKDGEEPASVINEFLDYFDDHRLVFYNAPFDMKFLRKAAAQVGRTINNPVSDALKMARNAFPGRKSYKLSDLAKDAGLNTANAHRALADCEMTLIVYAGAAATLESAEETASQSNKKVYPASIKATAGKLDGHLSGETAVFTGELSISRSVVAAIAVNAGCAVAGNLSKKTTILVVGDQDMSLLAGHSKSSKLRKAEEMNQKMIDAGNQPVIRILNESKFMALIEEKMS